MSPADRQSSATLALLAPRAPGRGRHQPAYRGGSGLKGVCPDVADPNGCGSGTPPLAGCVVSQPLTMAAPLRGGVPGERVAE